MIHSAEDVLLDGAKRILVDANVLIAFFDQRHSFHSKVFARLNPVYLSGAEFYYVQPCLLEFKEYWRRKMITECLDLRISEGYHLYREFKKSFDYSKQVNSKRQQLYLNDTQLKELRGTLEKIAGGKGVHYWFELCNQALANTLTTLEAKLDSSKFEYAKFNDKNLFPIERKDQWPKWDTADLMQEKFGLASNDSAILNMVNGAQRIDSFISNDGDILFAIANGALNPEINTYTFLDVAPYR